MTNPQSNPPDAQRLIQQVRDAIKWNGSPAHAALDALAALVEQQEIALMEADRALIELGHLEVTFSDYGVQTQCTKAWKNAKDRRCAE